jgi:hypothetical protein
MDFAKLTILFQGTLKSLASGHKCGNTFAFKKRTKNHVLSLLGDFKYK